MSIENTIERKSGGELLKINLEKQTMGMVKDGSAKDCTYIIPITEQIEKVLSLPETVSLPEGKFIRKKEFHASAMGFGTREHIGEKIKEAGAQGIDLVSKINGILSDINFSFTVDPHSIKLIHNLEYDRDAVINKTGQAAFESECSIVVDIDMPGMAELYRRMRGLGIELGKPSAHITLYIKDNGPATGLGIAITDFEKQNRGEKFSHIEWREISAQELSIKTA